MNSIKTRAGQSKDANANWKWQNFFKGRVYRKIISHLKVAGYQSIVPFFLTARKKESKKAIEKERKSLLTIER